MISEKPRGTVITYGTFDVLHYGHIEFLKRAAALGTSLVVYVSTDEFNEKCKGKKALLPYEKRKELVESLKCVSEVRPEKSWEQKPYDIYENGATAVVFGEDWTQRFDYLRSYTEVVYLPRTPGISSTMIRETNEKIKTEETEEN